MNVATQDVAASAAPRHSIAQVAPSLLSRWRGFALAAICLLATVLYAWRIGSEGWGNPYYTATVKSMSKSLTNFVFGSFDPVGVVTVDKPPMAFWPMVLSVLVFGYHGWSVLLPQVVEGVAAVLLLHRAVRRWAGENVALLAALVLAITPVTVAINRNSDPDTLMVLLLVAAGYAFTRSVDPQATPGSATRWLMLAGVFLGFGFLTKMLQPWIVVPAFAVAYLVGSRSSVGRRVRDLLMAGVALLASSAWWVALVTFWPGPKPYFGGSTNGSVLDLVFGYNGLGRIFGQSIGQHGPKGGHVGGPGGGGYLGGEPTGPLPAQRAFGGGASITRMFSQEVGGQISWLLPLCLLVLIVVAVVGLRRMLAKGPGDPAQRAGWFLWGGWLLATALVFSFMGGIFHPYYTTQLAPAVAVVSAAGVAIMWRHYRQPGGFTWLILPAAVVLTAGWAWVLVSRDTSWHGWLRYPVAVIAVLSLVLLVVARLSISRLSISRVALPVAGTVLGVVALLLAPAVWSAATAFGSGPSGTGLGQAGPAPNPHMGQNIDPGKPGGAVPMQPGPGKTSGQVVFKSDGGGRNLSDEQRKILQYAQANSQGARVTLAIEGGAGPAEPYIINTDAAVVGMGGFSGQDAAPTRDQLAQWVQKHQLRFVLASRRQYTADGGPQGNAGPATPGVATGPFDASASQQRSQWVQQNCTVVDPSAYGGSTQPKQDAGSPTPPDRNNVLYDCQAH